MAAVAVENVIKRFGDSHRQVTALADVSLQVKPGEFLAIMGASGSGKSTLLHLIAALSKPDSGRILVDDADLSKMNDRQLTLFRRRRIGLIFQAFNLIPTLSAEENIALPLMLDNTNGRDTQQKVGHLLETLGLQDRRNHRPDALSGGEQQRVAIGRALIGDASLVLADEPTGNLDSANSHSVCELLRDLSAIHHKTIVMVTHEPSVAIYAHQVAVLKDGHLLGQFPTLGTTGEALAMRYQEVLKSPKRSVIP